MNPYITRITGGTGPVQERGPLGQAIKNAFGGSADAAPDDEGAEAPPEAGGGAGAPPAEPPMDGGGGEGGGEGMPAGGGGDEGLEPWQQRMLEQIHERFVSERVQGFSNQQGQQFPPVPREEAEQRWLKVRPRFLDVIQNDPAVRARFSGEQQAGGGAMGGQPRGGAGGMCPHCGQPMPGDAEPQGEPEGEMPPPEGEMPPPPEGEGAPEPEPEPEPEPAGEGEQAEPEPDRGPRLPESARRMATRKLDDE